MSASGCFSKCSAKVVSSSLIWRLSSAMMPTVARVVAANAAASGAGAVSCWVGSAARISRARGDIALPATAFERRLDRRQAQRRPQPGWGHRDIKEFDDVDIVATARDGSTRSVHRYKAIPYDIPRGCAAGYMPEMNVLCAIGDYSTQSDQPIMKNLNVPVRQSI
jgi:hypothetical protein